MNFNIYNKQEEKVAILSTDAVGNHTAVLEASIDEKIDSYEVLTLTISAKAEESIHLIEGNTIVYKDLKGYREYYITEVQDIDGSSFEKIVTADLSSIELTDDVLEIELADVSANPKEILNHILKDTRWKAGDIDASIYNKMFKLETKYKNVLEVLHELADDYSCEIQYSYKINNGKISERFVNLYKSFGRDTGKRFEFGKDLTEIKRTIDISILKTTIIPHAPAQDGSGEDEDVEAFDISNIEWSTAKGHPVNKPLGQNFLVDPVALANFGRLGADGKIRHKTIPMEITVKTPDALINMAWMQLGRYSTPKITYEVKAIDLYLLTKDEDFSHEQIFLGDSIIVIDKNFRVPMMVRTRVVEAKRNLLEPMDNDFVFGTSKTLFSNVEDEKFSEIKEAIKIIKDDVSSIQVNADGYTVTFRGSKTPEKAKAGDIWFKPHPTIPNEKQMLVFNGTVWELENDTSEVTTVKKDVIETKKDTQQAQKTANDANQRALNNEKALVNKVGTDTFNSTVSQLEDNINLRVKEGDVINQINISKESILIDSNKIILAGDTKVDGSFKVTNQMIATGVSADKITVGTLNGKNVNIINLNADNITGGNLNIRDIKLMNGNQKVLSANQQGEVELNVTTLKIGLLDGATVQDVDNSKKELDSKIQKTDEKIDNMSSSSRNLIADSNIHYVSKVGDYAFTSYRQAGLINSGFNLEPNTEYTLTSYSKASKDGITQVFIQNPPQYNFSKSISFKNKDKFEIQSVTFTTPNVSGYIYSIGSYDMARKGGSETLWTVLTKGNVPAVDWIQAPEDSYTKAESDTKLANQKNELNGKIDANKKDADTKIANESKNINTKVDNLAVNKAYSNSDDGKVDFTLDYPKMNLLSTTAFPATNSDVSDINSSDTSFITKGAWANVFIDNLETLTMLKPNTTYTVSYIFELLSKGANTKAYSQNQHGSLLLYSGVAGYPSFNLGNIGDSVADANKWVVGSKVARTGTFKTPANLHDAPAKYRVLYYTVRSMKADGTTLNGLERGKFSNIKFEESDIKTIYTPSPTDDLIKSVPRFIGTGIKKSNNPADYKWELNPEYISNSVDVNKVDGQELDGILENISKDMEGKVGLEELKAIQEMTEVFKSSYEAFVSDGGQYEADLVALEDRMSALITKLDNKVALFEFVTTYMKLGNEGLLIGASDSSLKMLLSKDRLSFTDGGKEIAYFSKQSFKINQGAIIDSLQIGSHKFTKLNDTTTIIQYTGVFEEH